TVKGIDYDAGKVTLVKDGIETVSDIEVGDDVRPIADPPPPGDNDGVDHSMGLGPISPERQAELEAQALLWPPGPSGEHSVTAAHEWEDYAASEYEKKYGSLPETDAEIARAEAEVNCPNEYRYNGAPDVGVADLNDAWEDYSESGLDDMDPQNAAAIAKDIRERGDEDLSDQERSFLSQYEESEAGQAEAEAGNLQADDNYPDIPSRDALLEGLTFSLQDCTTPEQRMAAATEYKDALENAERDWAAVANNAFVDKYSRDVVTDADIAEAERLADVPDEYRIDKGGGKVVSNRTFEQCLAARRAEFGLPPVVANRWGPPAWDASKRVRQAKAAARGGIGALASGLVGGPRRVPTPRRWDQYVQNLPGSGIEKRPPGSLPPPPVKPPPVPPTTGSGGRGSTDGAKGEVDGKPVVMWDGKWYPEGTVYADTVGGKAVPVEPKTVPGTPSTPPVVPPPNISLPRVGEPFTSNGTLYMMLEGGKIVSVDKDGNQIDGPPFTGKAPDYGRRVYTKGGCVMDKGTIAAYAGGIIRVVTSVIGGWLAQKGLATEAETEGLAGAVIIIGTGLWSKGRHGLCSELAPVRYVFLRKTRSRVNIFWAQISHVN
ncbi:MAG: hypothetical protein WCK89_20015, partial [bacterium]